MTRKQTTFTKITHAGFGLLGTALLLGAAPWSAPEPTSAKPDGVRCHQNAECGSNRCLPYVIDRLPMGGALGYRHKGDSFCTATTKTCPAPEAGAGKTQGEEFKPHLFAGICKSNGRYVHKPQAKQLGNACASQQCVAGSCRGAGLNGGGTKYCTTAGKCPKANTSGSSVGTVAGRKTCASRGTWRLSDGQACSTAAALRISSCASTRCTPSYDGKNYCLSKSKVCSLPGKAGAPLGAKIKGAQCTKAGWKSKR